VSGCYRLNNRVHRPANTTGRQFEVISTSRLPTVSRHLSLLERENHLPVLLHIDEGPAAFRFGAGAGPN
jgi:hypothetical protein